MRPSVALRELKRWVTLGPSFLQTVSQVRSVYHDYRSLDKVVEETKDRYVSDKVNLVGHSYGGVLAMDFALGHPSDISSLVTVTAPFHGTRRAYLGNVMYLFGIRTPVLDELYPDTDFTLDMVAKIRRRLYLLAESGAMIYNVISTEDEFVAAPSMSLKHPPNITPITEIRVGEGHCESFFCDTTSSLVRRVISSDFPTILVHPLLENSSYFDNFLKTLTPEQRSKTVVFDYDFMHPLK